MYFQIYYPNCWTLLRNRLISATVSELESFLNALMNSHYYCAMTTTSMCTEHSNHQLPVRAVRFNPSVGKTSTNTVLSPVWRGENRWECYKSHKMSAKVNFKILLQSGNTNVQIQILTNCILHVVLDLAKALLEKQAVLLPNLSRMFMSTCVDNSMYMENSPASAP